MSKVDITVIIPSKNEEKNISSCLTPIQDWASKIIVVDSFSTDNTVHIAHSFGADVVFFDYKGGWPKKRQFILDSYSFSTSWILLLDSDEILTENVKKEIEEAISRPNYDGYYLFFRIEFLGKMLKYSSSDLRKLSLFRTGKGAFEKRFEAQDSTMGDMEVHEHVIVKGKVGVIKNPVIHRNINSLSRFIIKHDEYSNYECHVHTEGLKTELQERFWGKKEERRRYLKKLFIRNPIAPIIYFFHLFIIKGGFIDGRQGFYYILYQCMYLYFVHTKIYEIEYAQIKHNY